MVKIFRGQLQCQTTKHSMLGMYGRRPLLARYVLVGCPVPSLLLLCVSTFACFIVLNAHVQLTSSTLDITHIRKVTRLSPLSRLQCSSSEARNLRAMATKPHK